MRHEFVSDLVKELLGPRLGVLEQLPESDAPRNEYTTGQLFPIQGEILRRPEDEEAAVGDGSSGEEDGEEESAVIAPPSSNPGRNFRRVPSSFGISFVLQEAPAPEEFRVCVTWARYSLVEGSGWVREPKIWVQSYTSTTQESQSFSVPNEIDVRVKVSAVRPSGFKISVYVASAIQTTSNWVETQDIIFQPEIRISLRDPSRIGELGELGFHSNDPEWRVSTRQYDALKVFARGHLCGAYWKAIDPQRPCSGVDVESVPIPFRWDDGIHFRNLGMAIEEFFSPDLRTDFIPMYPAPAPNDPFEGRPADELDRLQGSLDSEVLASSRDPEELQRRLGFLADDYANWIRALGVSAVSLEIDQEIETRHKTAVARIRRGIAFLGEDREAFYSFLFMNKAMAKQYSWGKQPADRLMKWRPFQLAFILLALESSVSESPDREICDTIWFPTGGGKTEAYLGLAAFALAYRRRTSPKDSAGDRSGEGVTVLSRYTLRLLTIQQFRRALKMIMACEILRCDRNDDGKIGWRPAGLTNETGMLWGRTPFSLGLWVGGAVTPNNLEGAGYGDFRPGAFEVLKRPPELDDSDPAQVIECPCCATKLSMPVEGLSLGKMRLSLVVKSRPKSDAASLIAASSSKIKVESANVVSHPGRRSFYLDLDLDLQSATTTFALDRWWRDVAGVALECEVASFNVARPGYFAVDGSRGKLVDYEIRCPNHGCEINLLPLRHKLPDSAGSWCPQAAHPLFAGLSDATLSVGLAIPALTVDAQLYGYPPSMLISTVDKLAGLAFTNESASLFGRVRSYDQKTGFSQDAPGRNRAPASAFAPPTLIIQDELHLLEGPLGSTFGLYETVISALCGNPKYIASSATIRNSSEQIRCLMGKESAVFPPPNISIDQGYFLKSVEAHPLEERGAGRLFLGLAFPGRAVQTPTLRTWGRLLQTAQDIRVAAEQNSDLAERDSTLKILDHFWTLVGYFNAVRELAQAEALVRQDIPQFLNEVFRESGGRPRRDIRIGNRNLSSQTGSSELPGILASMEKAISESDVLNTVSSTSMFGTGVDVARLSLMIVHGQPKSASQYIQAVGRIGRRRAGLAVVFYRVSKPRDLNHYEYFTGYHRRLAIAVEPISVKPLAPKALDRTVGALLASFIRNWQRIDINIPNQIDFGDGGAQMADISPAAVAAIIGYFDRKWEWQPAERKGGPKERFLQEVRAKIDRWIHYAQRARESNEILKYVASRPRRQLTVDEENLLRLKVFVLGNENSRISIYSDVSRSFRDVESTIRLQMRG